MKHNIQMEILGPAEPPRLVAEAKSVRFHYPDGTISEPVVVEMAKRSKMDAVAVVAYTIPIEQTNVSNPEPQIYLRSALRPGAKMRDYSASQIPEDDLIHSIYEIPAGMVEPEEIGIEGCREAAAREFSEEIGITLPKERFKLMGARSFPNPGTMPERIFFFRVGISTEEAATRGEPQTDGHPMEQNASIIEVSLSEAKKMIRSGEMCDMKTEVGLYRLEEELGL